MVNQWCPAGRFVSRRIQSKSYKEIRWTVMPRVATPLHSPPPPPPKRTRHHFTMPIIVVAGFLSFATRSEPNGDVQAAKLRRRIPIRFFSKNSNANVDSIVLHGNLNWRPPTTTENHCKLYYRNVSTLVARIAMGGQFSPLLAIDSLPIQCAPTILCFMY